MSSFFMDLEFLCDEDFVYENDIIAICILPDDEGMELTEYIRPYDEDFEVSEYCTDLTGITKENLNDKKYFDEVYDDILELVGEDDNVYVWGNMDLEAVYKQSMEIAGQLEFNIIDFQDEFMKFCGMKFRPGLKKVYEALTGNVDIKHHDVRNDTMMLREVYRRFREDSKGVMRQTKGRMR